MDIEEKITKAIVEALNRVRGYVDRQLKDGAITPAPVETDGATSAANKLEGRQLAPVVFKAGPVIQEVMEAPKPSRVRITPNEDGTMVAVPEWDDDDQSDAA